MKPTIDDVTTLVKLQLGLKDVQAGHYLVEDLAAESADVLNIVLAIEEKYQVSIPDDDLVNIKTVADLYQLIQDRI